MPVTKVFVDAIADPYLNSHTGKSSQMVTRRDRVMLLRVNYVIVDSGPHLNIKTVLSTYGDFHVKDKTAVRTSYL